LDKVELIVNGETVTGQYGPPMYYPSFAYQSCSSDEQYKPAWVTEDHSFTTKQQCCEELFDWIELERCLGDGFVETNFIQDTVSPSLMPSSTPSQTPSASPGLCAKDESELPQIYRTAQSCNDDQLCPEGQQCFKEVSFSSNNENKIHWEPPSKRPTSHPTIPPSVMPTTAAPTITPGIAIQVEADATLSEGEPDKPYGLSPMLAVDGAGGESKHYDTLLKFDMSFMETGVSMENVLLRLFVKDGSGHCGTFKSMTNTWWAENSVTWNSLNDDGGIVIGQAWDAKGGEWFEMDVTGVSNLIWNDDLHERASEKYLGIRISSTIVNRCLFSSSNGPPLLAPHLWITLKDEESSSIAAASSNSAENAPVPSPSLSLSLTTTVLAHRVPGEALLLRATDDATISKKRPNLNLGEEASLVVDDDGSLIKDILIRFDITAAYKTIPKKAVLALYIEEKCESAGIFTTTSRYDADWIELGDDDHWHESEVTWSSAPSFDKGKYGGGTMIGMFGSVEGRKWFGFDVISALSWDTVNEQNTLTFRVSSDNGKHCRYASIQGGKAAKLMLEF